jgi:hypothetical protein
MHCLVQLPAGCSCPTQVRCVLAMHTGMSHSNALLLVSMHDQKPREDRLSSLFMGPSSQCFPPLQELVTSPQGKRVTDVVLVVLRNNTLTPLQYIKGKSTFWRVSTHDSTWCCCSCCE